MVSHLTSTLRLRMRMTPVGGHKAVLALKSPVFKSMLFGQLAETGDLVKIRKTSMFSFKEMLRYMHDMMLR